MSGQGDSERCKPCVAYAAKSTSDPRGSIPTQLEDIRVAVAREGNGRFLYGEPQTDEAKSAFTGNRGPGLAEAKRLAVKAAEEFGYAELWAQHSDRFARGDGIVADHLGELFFYLGKRGVRLRSVQDDSNLVDPIRVVLVGERNTEDSKRKSLATQAGKRRTAMRGKRNGGPRPFGYVHEVTGVDAETRKPISRLAVVPAEAEVIRWMADQYRQGLSQGQIARAANRLGHSTVRGCRWSESQVGAILRNRLYSGFVRYRDEWFQGEHEPILGPEELIELGTVRAARRRSGTGAGRPPVGNHLLTRGLLRCNCGASMGARTQRKARGLWTAYVCNGRRSGATECSAPAVSQVEIDTGVLDYFMEVGLDLDRMLAESRQRSTVMTAELEQRLIAARRKIDQIDAAIERVDSDYSNGELPARRYNRQVQRLEDDRAAAIGTLDQLKAREEELRGQLIHRDLGTDELDALARVRAAVAGALTPHCDVEIARAALGDVFECFILHRFSDSNLPAAAECELVFEGMYLEPVVRPERLIQDLVVGDRALAEGGVVERDRVIQRVAPRLGDPSIEGEFAESRR